MNAAAAGAGGRDEAGGFGGPRFVAAVLVVSLLLRLLLASQGGQYYFGDEGRYDRGVQLYRALAEGDFPRARMIAMLPEHMLFTWLGAAVTAGQHLLAQATPFGSWTDQPAHVTFTMGLGAALLSLFSTLNLALTHRLARAAGATRPAAAWALLLLAGANTAFYYSRHLVPYDAALAAGLLALVLGLGGNTPRRAFISGLLAGLCYGLYNGYWYLVPVVATVLGAAHRRAPGLPRFALWHAGGALLALALPVAYGTAVGGGYYWAILREFSGSVTQGAFAEGWSLPWEFLWHAEGAAGVAVILAIAAALFRARPLAGAERRCVLLMTTALVTAYGLLVLMSNGLGVFVVYGRTVKPFVPWLCVLGGWALDRLTGEHARLRTVAAGVAIAAGALNLWPHFFRTFPREVEIEVLRHWGNPKHTLTFTGVIYTPLALPVTRPDLVLVNAQGLYPVHHSLGLPPGRTLLRVTHPLSYLPFQYEGHGPRERALLRRHDLSIRLIALADPSAVPDDLPEALRARPLPPPVP